VQGNFPLDYRNMAILGSAKRQVEIMRVHRALSREALKARPDLVVWSETTYPIPIPEHFDGVKHPEEPLLSLTDVLAGLRVPHLVGADEIRRERRPRARPRLYNSALLFDRRGRITGRYRKQHLVPFGEKTPLEEVLPFMDSVVARAGGGGFVAGEGPGVVRLRAGARELPIGVLICYEAAFPALARRRVADGARVLVNLTNDAWFGGTSNPYQHAAMAAFRAVENRTPLLRCANTGITFAVRETGRVENPVRGPRGERMDIRGWVAQSVTPGRGPTVYSRCGDLFAGLCAAGAGLFLLAALVRRWKGA
jgi:apolipoprotein N-acyltransferase